VFTGSQQLSGSVISTVNVVIRMTSCRQELGIFICERRKGRAFSVTGYSTEGHDEGEEVVC